MTTGLLDTSVVIDWDNPAVLSALPDEAAVAAITQHSPPARTWPPAWPGRARRQARLQQVEATFAPLPFDTVAARSFGQVIAVAETGRSTAAASRTLLIAATAHANGLALYDRNPATTFAGLDALIDLVAL